MKKIFSSAIILFSLLSPLQAQETPKEVQDTLPDRELVKIRIINSDKKSAVGFRMRMSPENVWATSDEIGYAELDCSTTNDALTIYNPYYSNEYWRYKITFSPGDMDSIHTLTINWRVPGLVVDPDNKPLSGIRVELLGGESTVTDWSGEFSLRNVVPGDVMRITDPNNLYAERDAQVQVVSADKRQEIKVTHYIPAIFASRNDTTGIMYITDATPYNKSTYVPNYSDIQSLNRRGNEYTIKETKEKEYLSGAELQYSSDFGFSRVGRLPELQRDYAQGGTDGSHLKLMGPETNHTSAWGPDIKDLEYSNTDYSYDRNGSLVTKGTGNGTAAKTYDSKDFFRTGTSFQNKLDIKSAFIANSILSADFSQNRMNTPIPDSYREAYKGGVSINKLKIKNFTSDFGFNMNSTYDKLINNGGSHARLLHAVYTTPPTFDNSNGLSSKDATKSSQSWQLQDGSMRSYAPNAVNNPYYIVSQLADSEDIDNLLAYAKTKYTLEKLELEGLFSFNKQESNRRIYDMSANSLTRRADLSNLYAGLNASYKLNNKIKFKASYLFDKNEEGFEYKESQEKDDFSRNSHQFSYGMTFSGDLFYGDLTNKHYFSNTASDFTNLFPAAAINLNLNRLCYKLFDETWRFWYDFNLFASASRSLGEAPLLYKNKAALSTNMHSSEFQQYYETTEIPFNNLLKPEIYTNTEIGLKKHLFDSKLYMEAVYFHNVTNDFIAPHTHSSQSVVLENAGKVRNTGCLFTASYYFQPYYDNHVYGHINFTFNTIRNKVLSVHHTNEAIALAGFSNIQTVFAENEPLGAIYGTSYQRNDAGQMIIGDDGYPLIDTQLKKIGDSTPDFRMSLSPEITWKYLTFSMLMEYSHGGDRWNGTKAYLDYAGMSKESAELRNTKGFVFDGVTQGGSLNTKAIDFYDPTANLDENRWRRYGAEGVGEAYIEDASYFRLTEIALSCNLGRIIEQARYYSIIKNMNVGVRLNNILLITKYKGVDPESNLFGYTTGKGLDLFNVPSSRSFNFYVSIGF